jgi:hypothetical protein
MTPPPQPGWYPNRGDVPVVATVAAQPKDDPFYSHTDPLDSIAPGPAQDDSTALPVDQPDRQTDRQRHLDHFATDPVR